MTISAHLFSIALLFAQSAPGAPVVGKAERPAAPAWVEIKADPILTVLTAPDKSQWLLIDDGADLVSASDGKTATFAALAKGRYRVVVVGPAGEAARVVVVVGDVPPPKPPSPGPDVPPPKPVDPLTAKLQAAYQLDTGDAAKKLANLAELVELYAAAATLALSPDVLTVAALVARVREAAKVLVLEGLTDCRKVIAEELKTAFPIDAPLDDASRAKAKALFLRLASCLKEVK